MLQEEVQEGEGAVTAGEGTAAAPCGMPAQVRARSVLNISGFAGGQPQRAGEGVLLKPVAHLAGLVRCCSGSRNTHTHTPLEHGPCVQEHAKGTEHRSHAHMNPAQTAQPCKHAVPSRYTHTQDHMTATRSHKCATTQEAPFLYRDTDTDT